MHQHEKINYVDRSSTIMVSGCGESGCWNETNVAGSNDSDVHRSPREFLLQITRDMTSVDADCG